MSDHLQNTIDEGFSFDNMSEEEIDAFCEAMEERLDEEYASQIVAVSWPLKDFLSKHKQYKKFKFCRKYYSESQEYENALILRDSNDEDTFIYNFYDYTKDDVMQHLDEYIIELRKSGHLVLNRKQTEFDNGISFIQEGGSWGCTNKKGNVIVPTKYDTISYKYFDETNGWIVCGRNGNIYTGYIWHSNFYNERPFETRYTGVYDLYDTNGNLLLGGFIDYEYITKCNLFKFKYGQNYKLCEGDGSYNSPYRFKPQYGEWILLNSQFRFTNAYSYFKNDSFCWITENRTSVLGSIFNRKAEYLQGNVNLEDRIGDRITIKDVFYSDIECKNSTTLLCKREGAYSIFNLNGAFFTPFYKWIEILNTTYAYVYQNGHIGLLKKGFTAIPCKYSYITHPIDGWCFAAIKYPYTPNSETWNKYYVILCNVEKNRYDFIPYENIIVAIDNIDGSSLQNLFYSGALLLYKKGCNKDISAFTISKQYKSLFRSEFLNILNQNFYDGEYEHKNYWESAYACRLKLEYKSKANSIQDSYSLMDALDGDPSAYWNID